MKREEKYKNTNTFNYRNANPKNRLGGDCVVRAIAVALNQSWEQTVYELTDIGVKHGYVLNDKACFEKYLKQKGWVKHSQPRKVNGRKYTGKKFCEDIAKYETRYVANIGGHHTVAIVNCKVQDTWDSTDGCIGNYWTKG